MSLPTLTTHAAHDADALLFSLLQELQSIDLDEAHTAYRLLIRNRIEKLKAARYLLSDIETEAVCMARPGTTPTEARDLLAFAARGGEEAQEAA